MRRIVLRYGKKWMAVDLVSFFVMVFKVSKSEAKRMIESNAIDIFLDDAKLTDEPERI